MSKKTKLLVNLLGGEKRRHHVTAFVTQEGEWNRHEPNTGFARVFIAMLILHVFIIGGIILSDFASGSKTAPRSPAAQAVLTKSKGEIANSRPMTTSLATKDDGTYERYTIGSGDSLPMIVARFGVDKDELVRLNNLDQNGEFSAGSVLLIPKNKVAPPQQISAARPGDAGVKQPEPQEWSAVATVSEEKSGAPVNDSTLAAASLSTAVSAAGETTTVVALSSTSAAGAIPDLAPLPEISPSSAEPEESTKGDSPPETTKASGRKADSPPATTKAVDRKSDSVAKSPESSSSSKPPVKKAAAVSAPPKPVPPPSEMSKRPVNKPEKADKPGKADPATKTTTAKAGAAKSATTHVMAKGETLYRISSQYGVSVESLIKANGIKDPAKMRDGTKLIIPAKQ